jgi:hypothetical protein
MEQIPGENNPLFTLRHTIMSPSQPALVFDSAVMLQSCSCHVTWYMVLSKLVCINFCHTLIMYNDFKLYVYYILMFVVILLVNMF